MCKATIVDSFPRVKTPVACHLIWESSVSERGVSCVAVVVVIRYYFTIRALTPYLMHSQKSLPHGQLDGHTLSQVVIVVGRSYSSLLACMYSTRTRIAHGSLTFADRRTQGLPYLVVSLSAIPILPPARL